LETQTQPVQLQIYGSTFVPVRDLEMQLGEGYKYSAGTNLCSAKSRAKHSPQERFSARYFNW
jgi:nitroreductase